MNHTFFDNETPNPWKDRSSITYPKPGALLFVALMYLAASLELVFFTNEYVSMAVFAILCAGVLLVIRMPRGVTGLLTLSIIPIVLLRSFSIGALFLAIAVGTAAGTMLLTATRRPWQTVVLPAIAWTAAYVLTKNVSLASGTLLLIPAVLLLTYATLSDQRRSTAVCYALGGLIVSILILLAVGIYNAYGALDRDVIHTFFADSRAWAISLVEQARDISIQVLQERFGAEGEQAIKVLGEMLSHENTVNIVASIYNILPALVIICCSIAAFEAQSLLCGMYYANGMKKVLSPNATAFTMSAVSAGLYVIAFLLMMFINTNSLFLAVVHNCYLILTPGLFLVGWASLKAHFHNARGGSRVFTIVLAVFLVLFSGLAAMISLLAFVGAVMILLSYIGVMMLKRMQAKMGDQVPPDFEAWKRNFEQQAQNRDPETHEPEEDESPSEDEDFEEEEPEEEEPKEEETEDDDRQNGDS